LNTCKNKKTRNASFNQIWRQITARGASIEKEAKRIIETYYIFNKRMISTT